MIGGFVYLPFSTFSGDLIPMYFIIGGAESAEFIPRSSLPYTMAIADYAGRYYLLGIEAGYGHWHFCDGYYKAVVLRQA